MAKVCIGCGLSTDDDGNLIVNVADSATFPNGCDPTQGAPIYCTDAGVLRGSPPTLVAQQRTFENNAIVPPMAIPNVVTTVDSTSNPTVNPSSCSDALMTRFFEIDVEVDLDPGERIQIRFAGDEYINFKNTGSTALNNLHWQFTRASSAIVGPGAADTGVATIQVSSSSNGGALLERVQWSAITTYVTQGS